MSNQNNAVNSLAHSKWNCKYHVVFAPKYRRKVFFYEKREAIREIIKTLCDWKGVEIQEHTQTKKFKSYPTPFSTRKGAADAFDKLFKKFANSILVVSYSSNSQPTQDEMVAIMAKYKEHVEVIPIDYKYSFGNQSEAKTHRNSVQEYLFVGY